MTDIEPDTDDMDSPKPNTPPAEELRTGHHLPSVVAVPGTKEILLSFFLWITENNIRWLFIVVILAVCVGISRLQFSDNPVEVLTAEDVILKLQRPYLRKFSDMRERWGVTPCRQITQSEFDRGLVYLFDQKFISFADLRAVNEFLLHAIPHHADALATPKFWNYPNAFDHVMPCVASARSADSDYVLEIINPQSAASEEEAVYGIVHGEYDLLESGAYTMRFDSNAPVIYRDDQGRWLVSQSDDASFMQYITCTMGEFCGAKSIPDAD